jgi:hypothetical protein
MICTTTGCCLAVSEGLDDIVSSEWVDSCCTILASEKKSELSAIRQVAKVKVAVANCNLLDK